LTKRFRCLLGTHAGRVFVRNIYGDEINHVGGHRSWWRCTVCEREWTEPELHP
jgi:uncharacterized ferritin-like protein (DUF455 family)